MVFGGGERVGKDPLTRIRGHQPSLGRRRRAPIGDARLPAPTSAHSSRREIQRRSTWSGPFHFVNLNLTKWRTLNRPDLQRGAKLNIGKVGGVAPINHPRVEKIEIIGIKVIPLTRGEPRAQLPQAVNPRHAHGMMNQSRLQCLLRCLLCEESYDSESGRLIFKQYFGGCKILFGEPKPTVRLARFGVRR
jgi:hypothetical protein